VTPERLCEYALMVLGPVRYADKGTRAQTLDTLRAMLDEEFAIQRKAQRHPKTPDVTLDAVKIEQSERFDAVTLAKAGYLAPWKKLIVRKLGL
jgi:hypothetical protein